jgi:DNA-binding CsgD family transcriptional regulator
LAEQIKEPVNIAGARFTLAFIEWSVRDLDAAMRWLETSAPLAFELAMTRLGTSVGMMVVLIGILAGVGQVEEASELVERLQARTAVDGSSFEYAIAQHCVGVVRAARGDLDGALIALERAVEHHRAAVACPFERCVSVLELGRVQRRLRRKAEARATLERALAMFEELGAPLWAQAARAEIARIGGRTAADGLTPSERRIASLVADGRSNREVAAELFVTVRTVETALTRIYRKLGVRSRTELARKFVEAG